MLAVQDRLIWLSEIGVAVSPVGTDGAVVDYELTLRDVNVKKTDGPTKAKSSSQARSVQKTRGRLFTHSLRSFERIGF